MTHGILCPWNSPGKNTGVGCHALLQGIFPTQGWNSGLPHCRQILYQLSQLSEILRDENSRNLICLLRNLYAVQEAPVRTKHETTDRFQTGRGVRQGCILSPCLFNLYAEYIMRNPGLEEAQAGIKITRRNINNLRYADDTTLRQKVKN